MALFVNRNDVVRALFLDALRSRDNLRADRRRVLVATSKARIASGVVGDASCSIGIYRSTMRLSSIPTTPKDLPPHQGVGEVRRAVLREVLRQRRACAEHRGLSTRSSPADDARRWREGASTRRDAEIAPALGYRNSSTSIAATQSAPSGFNLKHSSRKPRSPCSASCSRLTQISSRCFGHFSCTLHSLTTPRWT